MKKRFVKFAAVILAAALSFPGAILTASAAANDDYELPIVYTDTEPGKTVASGECGEHATWTLDSNGTLTISGSGDMGYLDEEYGVYYEKPENWIWSYGPEDTDLSANVKRVVIEEGITSADFFGGCTNLTRLQLPSSLERIGNSGIGYDTYAFQNCRNLREVSFPSNIKLNYVEYKSFADTSWFWSKQVEDKMVIIGSLLYDGTFCEGDIVIPNNVKYLAEGAFYDDEMITSVTLPQGMTSIPIGAFSSCDKLVSVNLPSSISTIAESAFEGCEKLASVTLPDSITSIGYQAFAGDSALETIVFPKYFRPAYVSPDAFDETPWFEKQLTGSGIVLMGDYLWYYNEPASQPADVTVPAGVRVIGGYAFENSHIKTITLPEGVEEIGMMAFLDCEYLDKINLPASLKEVGIAAFFTGYDNLVPRVSVASGNPYFESVNEFFCTKGGGVYTNAYGDERYDFLCRLYQNFLGRIPDMGGFNTWFNIMVTGALNGRTVSGQEIVKGFALSPEFINKDTSDEEFIRALYLTIFGREADQGGLDAWKTVLAKGCTRKKVLAGFLNAQEMVALCERYGMVSGEYRSDEPADNNTQVTYFVARMYEYCLGRRYDRAGLDSWVNYLVSGAATGAKLADGFFYSQEMIAQNLSNEDFVKVAYRTLLDREADAGGLASWVKVLDDTDDRSKIIKGFVNSVEFGNLCQSYGIKAV